MFGTKIDRNIYFYCMKMRRIFLGGLFLALASIIHGQTIQVENASTGEPAISVAVFNQDKSRSILTDLDGKASLKLFNESDTLYFQHPSYVRYSITFKEAVRKRTIILERKNIIIPEFVITASKHLENKHDIAYQVDVLSPRTLERIPSQTSAEILTRTGNIFLQKSQAGGGSPVLRGFEANKVLLVVDGVRMNNAIYRGGHLQNSITIDNAILERAEIIYGPSSVIYGSDALGGVVHYITKDPNLKDSIKGKAFEVQAYIQSASANNSLKSHIDFNLGTRKFGSLTSITHSKFGDVRLGTRKDPFLGDWGKQEWYVQRINGIDSVIENPNPNRLLLAGYSQTDILQKFRYKPTSNFDVIMNLQYSESSNINRNDELSNLDEDSELPEFAEWYYGPQKRFLASLSSKHTASQGIYSTFVATIGFQDVEESRYTRAFRADTLYQGVEGVQVYSANFDFVKFLYGRNSANYGIEINHNRVSSTAEKSNIINNSSLPTLSRYPDGGTSTLNLGAYASFKMYLTDKLIASIGGRYQYYTLNSTYGSLFYDLPELFSSIDLKNHSFTGSLSLIYDQTKSLNWHSIISTGFRSPNLDDLAKIRAASGKLTLPNPDLKPENTYNFELGLSKTFDGYIQLNGNYFVSYLTDVIVREKYTLPNGNDSLDFQGKNRETYQNMNASEGIIHGFHVNFVSDLNSNISFKSTLNYTFGRNLTDEGPLAHIPPIFGRTNITYEIKRLMTEVSINYSGWKDMKDMVTSGEDKHDKATEHGFPGWYTLNFNSSFKVNNYLTLLFAIENLTDNFYHPFASGVPAPGINFIGTLRVNL